MKEKAEAERVAAVQLKKKGNALQMKKDAEENRRIEEEAARKAMELEADMEANMSLDERKALERKRIEEADNALTEDLFGGMTDGGKKVSCKARGSRTVGPTHLQARLTCFSSFIEIYSPLHPMITRQRWSSRTLRTCSSTPRRLGPHSRR